MAVSLPTHVTGYFLEDLIPTILIYVCVGAGFIYSGLAVTTFFGTLEEAVNEQYRSGEFKKKTKLDVVHLLLPVSLLVIIGSSAGLYVFGLKHTHEEWNAWW